MYAGCALLGYGGGRRFSSVHGWKIANSAPPFKSYLTNRIKLIHDHIYAKPRNPYRRNYGVMSTRSRETASKEHKK